MNIANYTENKRDRYPLSTKALDFIQNQILLVARLTALYGDNFIITPSSGDTSGLIVINGELMPLTGTPCEFIVVTETSDSVTARDITFENIRTYRTAQYSTLNTQNILASNFQTFQNVQSLIEELAEMKMHVMPKGSIIMWSGDTKALPSGFALCDGNNNTPDLRGRFIVGYDPKDTEYEVIGNTGGKPTVTLTIDEMPSHYHEYASPRMKTGLIDGITLCGDESAATYGDSHSSPMSRYSTKLSGGDKSHENRPPYYTLAYIMKTI